MFTNFKNISILAAAVLTMVVSATSSAQIIDPPRLVDVGLTTAYIPNGFDSNDRTEVMVESYLPDTCYKLGPNIVTVDEKAKKIEIRQQAYLYKGMCLLMIVPYYHMVSIGLLKTGTYEVTDFTKKRALGQLPVKEAVSSEADDNLYAPVHEATVVERENGKHVVTLNGVFTNQCMRVSQVKVIRESKTVVTVLPITEVLENKDCKNGEYPFQQEVELSGLELGRYLLHVRSLNGNAVTKLFDVK